MHVHLAGRTVPSHSTTSGTTSAGEIKRITACTNNTINAGEAAAAETETAIPNTGTNQLWHSTGVIDISLRSEELTFKDLTVEEETIKYNYKHMSWRHRKFQHWKIERNRSLIANTYRSTTLSGKMRRRRRRRST